MANSAQHTLLDGRSQQEGTSGGSEALALFNRYGFFPFVNQVTYYESFQFSETEILVLLYPLEWLKIKYRRDLESYKLGPE